jgi:hypothetical protein
MYRNSDGLERAWLGFPFQKPTLEKQEGTVVDQCKYYTLNILYRSTIVLVIYAERQKFLEVMLPQELPTDIHW